MKYFLFYKEKDRCALTGQNFKPTSKAIMLLLTKFAVLFLLFFVTQSFNEVKAQTVTLNLKNASLAKATEEISKQTKYDFSYNDLILKKAKPVTLKLVNEPLAGALKKLFSEQPISYELKDRMIILIDKKNTIDKNLQTMVTGRVTDEKGNSIIDAVVNVKGTTYSTRTDKNGNFNIPGQYASEMLEIHHLGYAKLEINAQRARVITLTMAASDLKEVSIITGYQEIKERSSTVSAQIVKGEVLDIPGINTIDKALEGKIPGMIYYQNSGQVGAAPKLRIRGTSTVLGNREPLWVLDGIVLQDPVNIDPSRLNDLDFVNLLGNAIAGLNPQDIEQITVLKDAAATALYGTKAGNGVIVITTKKGKSGKPTISYNTAVTLTQRPRYSDANMNMMNSMERIDVSKELVERGIFYNNVTQWSGYEDALQNYYKGNIDYNEFKRLSDYYGSINTDWFGLLTRDSFSQNHTLTLSGGSSDVKYYSSLGYTDEQGTLNNEYGKRYSSVLNITADYKKFMAQIGFTGNYSNRNYSPTGLGVLNYAYNMSRTMPAYNPDGSLFFYPNTDNGQIYNYNILKEQANSGDNTKLIEARIRAFLKLKLTTNFNLEGTFSYGISNNNRQLYYTKDTYYISKLRADRAPSRDMAPIGGELQRNENTNNNYMARLQANYITAFGEGKVHNLTAMGGIELQSNQYNGFNITRRGYFPEMGGYYDFIPVTYTGYYQQFMANDKSAVGYNDRQLANTMALYASTGYSYRDKYMFNVHMRAEQSNLFGRRSNNKLLPIWAISGRWNMKEDLFSKTSWINDVGLKASWGWQGNAPGQSPYMIMTNSTLTNPYYGSSYATIANFPNPDLKWEKTSSSNVAVDFALFNNKVKGTLGYFYKKTTDAFLNKSVADINGVESYIVNSGTLENKGIEVMLSITAIDNAGINNSKRGFVWRFDPQLGQVLNKVLTRAINNRNNVLIDRVNYSNFIDGSIQLAGKPLNTFYSYRFKGLNPTNGLPLFYGLEQENAAALQKKYSQMSKEALYQELMSESGRRDPFIQGGLSNYFGWRNFGFTFNLTYSLGNKIRLMKIASGNYATLAAYPQQNLRREFVYRWRKPGDEMYTNIPGLQLANNLNGSWWQQYPASSLEIGGSLYELYDNSDVRLVSANHLKLQSASFRYNFDEKLMRKLGLGVAYVSLTGTNLYTWSNKALKGQDPTQSGSSPNINLTLRPTYSASINVSF